MDSNLPDSGDRPISQDSRVTAGVPDPTAGTDGARGDAGAAGRDLSDRETESLRLIALGYSNKEIAGQMAISVKTVETFKARAIEKLGLRSRVEIVRYASRRGWLTGL